MIVTDESDCKRARFCQRIQARGGMGRGGFYFCTGADFRFTVVET